VLVLDTDTLTVLVDPRDSLFGRLHDRLGRAGAADHATTAVSLQEQMRGRLGEIHRAKRAAEILEAYDNLVRTFDCLKALQVLPYDQPAQTLFELLRPQFRRLGTLDLRIACIALTRSATVLTRNLRDFRQVPGLSVEDWSRTVS
jgi:tRNA(fMet)-specific endonuclease VapC